MTQIYDILDKIKVLVRNHPIVNSVTFGDLTMVDLNKTTMFPLTHFLVSSAQMSRNVITFRISMLFMDVVDYTKDHNPNEMVIVTGKHSCFVKVNHSKVTKC